MVFADCQPYTVLRGSQQSRVVTICSCDAIKSWLTHLTFLDRLRRFDGHTMQQVFTLPVVFRREVIRERERLRQESLAQSADNLETPAANESSQAAPADTQLATDMHRAYLSRP